MRVTYGCRLDATNPGRPKRTNPYLPINKFTGVRIATSPLRKSTPARVSHEHASRSAVTPLRVAHLHVNKTPKVNRNETHHLARRHGPGARAGEPRRRADAQGLDGTEDRDERYDGRRQRRVRKS